MAFDLKSMNSKELEKLLNEVKKTLQSAQARDRRQARKAAEKAAAEWGFSLNDLSENEKPAKKERKNKAKANKPKSKPQFANPADPSQTWTGKGRQPNWFRAEVEKGTTPDSMKI
ncbi:MAG: H-NS histone family protein [Sulfitobacter sp.]